MTSNIKEKVIELIRNLPEDATLDDIMYHLHAKIKILKGFKEIDEGKFISHDQVMENVKKSLEKWLK